MLVPGEYAESNIGDMVECFSAGMIIFLVPIVGALTTRFAHFDMIHLGSYLSALSPLWIVAFPHHGTDYGYLSLYHQSLG